jgi:RHS repeat-associated protein
MDYLPYGTENAPANFTSTCSTRYKFTGYERDEETDYNNLGHGLDYAFARYYNPRLARFMSADPLAGDIADPQSLNRYAYVGNNPINFTDPTGMDPCYDNEGVVDLYRPNCGPGGGGGGDPLPNGRGPDPDRYDCGSPDMTYIDWAGCYRGCEWRAGGRGCHLLSGGTPITRAIQRVQEAVSNDSKCLAFLNNNGGDALGILSGLVYDPSLVGSQALGATSNPNGSISIIHAMTPGVPGQAITINTDGGFYNGSYNDFALTVDRGRIRVICPLAPRTGSYDV